MFKALKKFFSWYSPLTLFTLVLLSGVVSSAVVTYTSSYQMQSFLWLQQLMFYKDDEGNPCDNQFEGYGRLYKHGCFVNPVSVVQSVKYEIAKAQKGLELTAQEKQRLFKAVNFLKEWAEPTTFKDYNVLLAPYQFSWDYYGLKSGWFSGMAQGHIIEALVAAYIVDNDRKFIEAANKFANAFYMSVEEGGVTVWTEHGPWFEEYAQKGIKPSYALNGHIFAIEGLHRLVEYSPQYKDLIFAAVHTTERKMEYFNTGWWSKYDLRGTLANQKYHHIHIRQLHWLGIEFYNDGLKGYGQSFLWQQLNPLATILHLATDPYRFLVFLFFLNFMFILLLLVLLVPPLKIAYKTMGKS